MPTKQGNLQTTWTLIDLSEDAQQDRVAVQSPLVIGRREETDLCLNCSSVSGKHAQLNEKGAKLWIKDLRSTNGTFVNGIRITESTQLISGDIVQFGSIVFQVDADNGKPIGGRRVAMQTVESDIPESSAGRFHRLLRVGVVPYFQPVFDISEASPQLSGYEILGRGRLPGLRTPEEMFSAATEMEKTAELSETLRKHGIEVADANFSSGKLIFVNTHPSEISSERLVESLARIRTCFPDRRFILELPAAILEDPDSMSLVEAATKDMNIDTSIYGFGSTAIQLEALVRLSPKVVKFSKSLVRNIETAPASKKTMISSMIKMLVELGIQPMAEMVETAREHKTIKQLGFELAQGFHYGHPSSVEHCLEGQQTNVAKPPAGSASKKTTPTDLDVPLKSISVEPISVEPISVEPISAAAKGAQWMLEQPAENYTVQVMVTTSREGANAFVSKQDSPESFAVYLKKGTRRNLFVVSQGSFVDRKSARTAADKLHDATCFPLIRMIENVQTEVRKANS